MKCIDDDAMQMMFKPSRSSRINFVLKNATASNCIHNSCIIHSENSEQFQHWSKTFFVSFILSREIDLLNVNITIDSRYNIHEWHPTVGLFDHSKENLNQGNIKVHLSIERFFVERIDYFNFHRFLWIAHHLKVIANFLFRSPCKIHGTKRVLDYFCNIGF